MHERIQLSALVRQFYYEYETGQCVEFNYTGCEGNANRFATAEECLNHCGSIVRQQALTLPLEAYEEGPGQYVERLNEEEREVDEYVDNDIDLQSDNPHSNDIDSDKAEEEEVVYVGMNEDAMKQKRGEPVVYVSEGDYNAGEEETDTEDDESDVVTVFPQVLTAIPELCLLSEDRGTCFGQHLRWRYDSEREDCASFIYTGCKHNHNYFTSEEACLRACGKHRNEDVCRQPKDEGTCNASTTKWYYDTRYQECHMFMWTGCAGNGNRFSSKAECENLCSRETKVSPSDDPCTMPRDSGPCLDAITQWFFEPGVSECQKFTFGGCRGNANRFNTKQECEGQCKQRSQNLKLIDPRGICSLPFAAGNCGGIEKKWSFDISAGECRTFTYSGCDGNQNRFDSEIECYNICKSFVRPAKPSSRAILKLLGPSNVLTGSTIKLRCIATDGEQDFAWYHNGTQLDATRVDTARIKFSPSESMLEIQNSVSADAGTYACAAGSTGMISDTLAVTVQGTSGNE
ncbi:papilin [Aphelenchoides avenae]|nr:papilin [Aphelenchus avenae]